MGQATLSAPTIKATRSDCTKFSHLDDPSTLLPTSKLNPKLKVFLKKCLNASTITASPNWKPFIDAFKDWTKNSHSFEDLDWLPNSKYQSSSSSSSSSLYLKHYQTPSLLSKENGLRLSENNSRLLKTCPARDATSLVTETENSREELVSFLKCELDTKGHPVAELVKIFNATYENIASKFERANLCSLTEQIEIDLAYSEAVSPVKHFIILIRKLLIFMYQELGQVFETRRRELDADCVPLIDSIVYDLVFSGSDSKVYRSIYRCLELKKAESLYKIRLLNQQNQKKSLRDFDSQISERCLLIGCKKPYSQLIEEIRSLRNVTNPFTKKQILSSLDTKMKSIIQSHGHNGTRKGQKLIMELDEKLTIYIYSILKSSYESIILDLSFIDEFTPNDEYNQPYTHFRSCLKDHILSGEYEKYQTLTY